MDVRRYEGREDAHGIARVNALAWRAAYDGLLPDALLDALPHPVGTLRPETLAGDEVGRQLYEVRGFDRAGTASHEVGDESCPTAVCSPDV